MGKQVTMQTMMLDLAAYSVRFVPRKPIPVSSDGDHYYRDGCEALDEFDPVTLIEAALKELMADPRMEAFRLVVEPGV